MPIVERRALVLAAALAPLSLVASVSGADFQAAIEPTSWGTALRLQRPLMVAGTPTGYRAWLVARGMVT